MSCSWDQSIRVWNAWKKQVKRREPDEEGDMKDADKIKKVEISVEEEEEEEELGEGQINPADSQQADDEGVNSPNEQENEEQDTGQ